MQQSAHNLLAGLLVFLAAGALSNDLLDDSLLLDEEGADDPGESGQQHEKGNGEQMRSRVTRSQAAVSDSHKKDARKKLKRGACRGEVSSTACAAAAAQKMNVLLPGAVHAQDATVCAGHGALTLLQPLGFLRADGLDTGELDAAVGLTAHGSSGLLGVVVGNEAASCRCK